MISALYVDPKGCYSALDGVDLWDEARVFEAPVKFEKGIASPVIPAEIHSETVLVNDTLKLFYNLR